MERGNEVDERLAKRRKPSTSSVPRTSSQPTKTTSLLNDGEGERMKRHAGRHDRVRML
jgi:hypothetical protein